MWRSALRTFALFEEQLGRPFVCSRLEIGVEIMSLSVAMLAQGLKENVIMLQ